MMVRRRWKQHVGIGQGGGQQSAGSLLHFDGMPTPTTSSSAPLEGYRVHSPAGGLTAARVVGPPPLHHGSSKLSDPYGELDATVQ